MKLKYSRTDYTTVMHKNKGVSKGLVGVLKPKTRGWNCHRPISHLYCTFKLYNFTPNKVSSHWRTHTGGTSTSQLICQNHTFACFSVPGKHQGQSQASRDALQSLRHGGKRLAQCFGVSAPMDLCLVAAAIKSGLQTGAFCIQTVDPVEKIPWERKGET